MSDIHPLSGSSYPEYSQSNPLDVNNHPDTVLPTPEGASFAERFPAAAFNSLGVRDKGPSIDEAFSSTNSEYPLGTALRKKARSMK